MRPENHPALHTEKPVYFISYSGGQTSAYMVDKLLLDYGHLYTFVVTFANTGQEHDKTLEFVHQCDLRWGGIVVWLEAVVTPEKGEGTRYTIVTYDTATRRGDVGDDTPFAQVIRKYGLPGPSTPQICTRELKGAVMGSYRRDFEAVHGKKCWNAIGMRADEQKRLMKDKDRQRFRVVYPLADWFPVEKQDVLDYWDEQDFKLMIPEHLGNCVSCWKKSDAKHVRIIHAHPEYYNFFEKMEKEHPQTNNKPGYADRRFFRNSRTVGDMFKLAGIIPINNIPPSMDEVSGGCSESCEASTPETLGLSE
jgi:3'-phosphoadenosine 5'-phosphosulfate sulfotransferase (PAPS reductase)/FAD synthetase/uncharacterized short protein YbdD (DUF466 family)